jgi:uncharacterized protein YfaT (DUF1175 family)
MPRRFLCHGYAALVAAMLSLTLAWAAHALMPGQALPDPDALTPEQSAAFRAWFVRIVDQQIHQGPSPHWAQRDCAGLVRFAAMQALREHDANWRRANGMNSAADAGRLPPEPRLNERQRALATHWMRIDGSVGAYASAIALVQHNSRFVSRDVNQALPGDLLFFDQGHDQHLMIWLDRSIAYHTGTVTSADTGLRAVSVSDLLRWKDSRWIPFEGNPNFAGVYRFNFLTP